MSAERPPDPPRHALLRQGETWPEAAIEGLDVLADGTLELARVPALSPPWAAAPGPAVLSGLALDGRCGLVVADGEAGRLLRLALDCGERMLLDDRVALGRPAGVCIGPHGWIVVADPPGSRLLVLTAGLGLREAWTAGLVRPVAVASDGERWVAVLDAGAGRIRRFDAGGTPDAAFDAALAPPAGPQDARALAAGPDGTLYVATSAGVRRFGPAGEPAGPVLAPGLRAGPLAVAGDVLAVADETGGEVLRFALSSGRPLGAVAGFRGAVAALALDRESRVYVKPGEGPLYLIAEPGRGRLESGRLTAGPFDAGAGAWWERAAAEADVPAGSGLSLVTAVGDDADAAPAWAPAPATDVLLAPGRFLWLRVKLARGPEGLAGPSLRQVHAHGAGASYLDHLPAAYRRDPEAAEPLRRFLALAQSELDDAEAAIELLPTLADPQTAPVATLEALLGWLGVELPPDLAAGERWPEARALLGELPELLERGGTPDGIGRWCEILSGVRPRIFEGFRDRRTWILGETGALGFDTALLPSDVEGLMVGRAAVGSSGPEDAAAWGAVLFAASAHLVTVVLPAVGARTEGALRAALAAHLPAHTVPHLCVLRPRIAVGVQARVGLDTVVGGPPDGLALGERGRLDIDSLTAPGSDEAGTVGRTALLGIDTTLA